MHTWHITFTQKVISNKAYIDTSLDSLYPLHKEVGGGGYIGFTPFVRPSDPHPMSAL